MISVGYLAKQVATRPDWLHVSNLRDIYSVSDHVSRNFMDYIKFWRHNGYWLFDNPQIIQELAVQNDVRVEGLTFFYYEAYEKEFDEQSKQWHEFTAESFPTDVILPAQRELQGYDVVAFGGATNPGCSPLSCNHLAREIRTNSHCLLDSFEETRNHLEVGKFDHCEPGPFRIFAVYTIDPNHWLDE